MIGRPPARRLLVALLLSVAVAACGGEDETANGDNSSNNSPSGARDMTTSQDPDMGGEEPDLDPDPEDMEEEPDPDPEDMGGEEPDFGQDMSDPMIEQDMSDPMTEEDMSDPTPSELYVGSEPIYQPGALFVTNSAVAQGQSGAPTDLQIWAPTQAGEYAVIVFQHGFSLRNSYYSQMLEHVASHGFIVVAPQMYEPSFINTPSTPEEAQLAAEVWSWLSQGLDGALAQQGPGVVSRPDLFGVAGHSRGSKAIWLELERDYSGGMMRGYAMPLAAVGVDPVDGTGGPLGGEDRVIQENQNGMIIGFDYANPTLFIGTGLGGQSRSPLEPACAPTEDNYTRFYAASSAPTYQVVATEHGHMDMLDDSTPGCALTCSACIAGPDKATMRRATAGWIVAMMRGALQGDASAYGLLEQPGQAPVMATATSR